MRSNARREKKPAQRVARILLQGGAHDTRERGVIGGGLGSGTIDKWRGDRRTGRRKVAPGMENQKDAEASNGDDEQIQLRGSLHTDEIGARSGRDRAIHKPKASACPLAIG